VKLPDTGSGLKKVDIWSCGMYRIGVIDICEAPPMPAVFVFKEQPAVNGLNNAEIRCLCAVLLLKKAYLVDVIYQRVWIIKNIGVDFLEKKVAQPVSASDRHKI
jgi:hypothetical protein